MCQICQVFYKARLIGLRQVEILATFTHLNLQMYLWLPGLTGLVADGQIVHTSLTQLWFKDSLEDISLNYYPPLRYPYFSICKYKPLLVLQHTLYSGIWPLQ